MKPTGVLARIFFGVVVGQVEAKTMYFMILFTNINLITLILSNSYYPGRGYYG